MIKGIEVGGVVYRITLGAEMIGTGLKIVEGGKIVVDFGRGLTTSTGNNTIRVDVKDLVGSGLLFSNDKICFDASAIVALHEGIMYTTSGLAISGADVSRKIAGVGLITSGNGLLQANVSASSGLTFVQNKMAISIPKRTSGLRLFFDSSGNLDVTQD